MNEGGAPLGFSEVPPQDGQTAKKEQEGLHKRETPQKPAERPVYIEENGVSTEPSISETPKQTDSGFVFSVLGIIVGFTALGFSLFLYQQSRGSLDYAVQNVSKIINTTGQISGNASGDVILPNDTSTLQAELARTLSILDRMANEYSGEKETIGRIDSLRKESQEIMELLRSGEGKSPK